MNRLQLLRAAGSGMVAVLLTTSCSGGDDVERAIDEARPTGVFPLVGEREVQAIEITSGTTTVRLTRRGRGWRADPGSPPPSATLLTESEGALLPVRAYRRLDTDATRADLGLVDAEFVVDIEGRRGRSQRLEVGGPNFVGAGFYAQRPGDDRVYLLSRSTLDVLRSLVTGARYVSPRPTQEVKYLADLEAPEEVIHPWLGQALEEDGQ